MSLFFRGREERLVSGGDWFTSDRGWSSVGSTASGERVTSDSALRVQAFWAATNLLSNIVADLPVDVFRGEGGNRRPVSPQPSIVAAPSLLVSRREWTAQALMSLFLRGNAYGLVMSSDSAGRPTAVEWAHPDSVRVTQPSSFAVPEYRISGVPTPRSQIVHLRAFVSPGAAVGLSPVEYQAQGLGISLAGLKYGGQWFGDGAHPTAVLSNVDRELDAPQAKSAKERFVAAVRGSREPAVLGKGWKYDAIQISPSDSALLDTLEYTDAQVCRIFGPGLAEVLGYKTGGSLDYTTRIDRTLDLLQFTANHWVVKLEDALNAMTARPQYVKFNTDSLLRTDPKTRWDIHRIKREIGAANADEIRDIEDLPPLPDGQGQDYTPLRSGAANSQQGDSANAG